MPAENTLSPGQFQSSEGSPGRISFDTLSILRPEENDPVCLIDESLPMESAAVDGDR
jgi:hypothetical protein